MVKSPSKAKKKAKKKKVKKGPTPQKQAKDLRFLPADEELNITSLDTIKVIGARRVVMFDTKNRTLHVLIANKGPDGFGGKGMGILNFNPKDSLKIKLRKPEDIINIALTKADCQLDDAIKALTTKRQETNGRTSHAMVLLKAIPR